MSFVILISVQHSAISPNNSTLQRPKGYKRLNASTFLQRFGTSVEGFVPFVSETADQWFTEEAINRHALVFAKHFGRATDFPAVVVDGAEMFVLCDTYGVEVAGDRFHEVDTSFAIRFFDGAFARALRIVIREDAIFAVDDRRDHVVVRVDTRDSLTVDDFARLRREIVPYFGQNQAEDVELFLFERCARVAFDAAFAFAFGKVAEE